MAAKRTRSSTSLDLSRTSPVLESSVTLGNDTGSTTKGVGTTKNKSKLVRSGSGTGSGQGTLGFSSKKNTPVTPVKSKGVKRTVTEVEDVEERAVHPMFAAARKGEEAKHPEASVEAVDVDDDAQNTSIQGISGVPLDDKWDPLLLHTSSATPTKEMQQNLNIHTIPHYATLDSSPDEQTEDHDSMTTGRRTVQGLAVRKAMLRADARIKQLRDSGTKKAAPAGKVKGGLNPNDKRWGKVYKAAWQSMGGDDITPIHTTPKTHTKIHHILRVFDLSPQYGPCVGISRLARWERAKAWGLEPPEEIREILETKEGAEDVSYRETVFEGTGIYCPTA